MEGASMPMPVAMPAGRMARVRHKLLVLSGKGGVGKSTVAVNLAQLLVERGFRVGLLDIDLTGPSVPRITGLCGRPVHQASSGWVPVFADASQRLAVMSIQFLLQAPDDPVVWRGPKKTAVIKQLLEDVVWGDLDYLVVDTPPGTSDEHIAVCECLQGYRPDGAVLVTTPQEVAVSAVLREVAFCQQAGLRILGVFENMSGFVCEHCQECTSVFGSGGGKALADHCGVEFLGALPVDPRLSACEDAGVNFVQAFPASPTLAPLRAFVGLLAGMDGSETGKEMER